MTPFSFCIQRSPPLGCRPQIHSAPDRRSREIGQVDKFINLTRGGDGRCANAADTETTDRKWIGGTLK